MLTTQHGLKYIRSVHMFSIPCFIFIPWVICEYSPFPSQNFISKISTFLHGTFSLHQYFLSLKVIPQFCTGKSFTADKNHVIRRISARIPGTRHCFFNKWARKRGTMVCSSWTSTMTYIFLLHNFGVQIIPFKLDETRKKKVIEGKKRCS